MSIVVTGATGQLGRLIVQHLIADGVPAGQITATGRRVERIADLAEQGVRVVESDYTRPETLVAAFAGADTLMLVSGSEVGRRTAQHRNAIDAAVTAGVRRIVYTSVLHADRTTLPVAPEHVETEQLLRDSGLAITLLRNGWYTENYLGDLAQAAETGTIVAAVGDGRVASATRDDYAAAAAVVLRTEGHEGAVYELSGDQAWTFDDLAAAATEVLGRPVEYRRVTVDEHRELLAAAGLDEGTIGFLLAMDQNTAAGELADTTGQLAALIGRPTTPLADALRAARAEG
ncbi:SDR family oxidoreductase [Cellulomonas denverensis]|uniref:SDR family oxidoreductase n=1 Tax=Cellulomonas denverensis TaxID=264297 RepID=A0A7X6KT18_9CELL|nr:SDR family oxidoreductase [Cellulomonas denverensis]NKY21777.1 SDR family oxidoreductase [Cellulomonas denverensis]GIG25560.1 NAD(P)-dependent oxidoreductase [Cellulomonas denverensis]